MIALYDSSFVGLHELDVMFRCQHSSGISMDLPILCVCDDFVHYRCLPDWAGLSNLADNVHMYYIALLLASVILHIIAHMGCVLICRSAITGFHK